MLYSEEAYEPKKPASVGGDRGRKGRLTEARCRHGRKACAAGAEAVDGTPAAHAITNLLTFHALRHPHNLKVVGSNPTHATTLTC